MKYFVLCFVIAITACSSSHYYVVRHAEKTVLTKDSASMMMNNPPLSEAGKVRAFVLRDELVKKHIRHIYSTNTIRSRASSDRPSGAGVPDPRERTFGCVAQYAFSASPSAS